MENAMNKNNKRFPSSRVFILAPFLAVLVACGGGGSESTPATAQRSGTNAVVAVSPAPANPSPSVQRPETVQQAAPVNPEPGSAAGSDATEGEKPGVIQVGAGIGGGGPGNVSDDGDADGAKPPVDDKPDDVVKGDSPPADDPKDAEPVAQQPGDPKLPADDVPDVVDNTETQTPPPADPHPYGNVAKVRVTPFPIELGNVGATLQLSAAAYDAQGMGVQDVPFVWSTNDPLRVEVTADGLITAKAEGMAEITARAPNGVVEVAQVQIKNRSVRVTIAPDAWPTEVAYIGARRQFTAEVRDGNGQLMPDAVVTWESSDPQIAAVDETGLATARQRSTTTARIIARVDGASDEIEVDVRGEGSNVPGYMYTAWFARTDPTPMLIVNGRLTLPANAADGLEFYGNISYIVSNTPVWPHNTVEKFEFEGNRIALLTDVANGRGTLRIFDRAAEMTILALGDAIDFDLAGNRIGLLSGNGQFRIKEGTHGAWIEVADSGVTKFVLHRNLIGILLEDGSVRVKNGINGPWVVMAEGDATDFTLAADDRVVLLRNDGMLRASDGLSTDMTDISSSARSFKASGNRIAAVLNSGSLRVKDGIHGPWHVLTTEAPRQYEISGDRIGVLSEEGEFRAKDGIATNWYVFAASGAQAFEFQGNRIGVVTAEGRLRIKTGLEGTWTQSVPYGTGISQFRLIVDNPVPPKRTTPASYSTDQARCRNATELECYHVSTFAFPVPYYGFFCGGGRPEGGGDGMRTAFRLGSIDGLDEMCAHHDNIGGWYARAYPYAVNPWNGTGSCIVYYGLRHGRLTRDGATIATGSSSSEVWDGAWAGAGMANLKDGLDNFFIYTNDCSESALQRLDEAMDAEND